MRDANVLPENMRPASISGKLLHSLVSSQFPQWADLPVTPVQPGGWDNRTFRLGTELLVRMPSSEAYAKQVEKDHRWLPVLAPALPLAIPATLALGTPEHGYPFQWGVYRWIEGEPASCARIEDLVEFATTLGGFLRHLQAIAASDGPKPGNHNFHRGGVLAIYDAEVREALAVLGPTVDVKCACDLWNAAVATTWRNAPVWVHGDIVPTNLLLHDGRLTAVIDFGLLAIGDPACDISIYWTFLRGAARAAFRTALPLDEDTWLRGRAWALWKALVVAARIAPTNVLDRASALVLIRDLLLGSGDPS